GFVATRDIKPGTVILDENPVVVCPFTFKDPVYCLTCGLVEDEWQISMRGRRCTRCKWPICSLECERLAVHAGNECQIFANEMFSQLSSLGFLGEDVV
ncbi:unnamed protein product, partial [Allacma fusca]